MTMRTLYRVHVHVYYEEYMYLLLILFHCHFYYCTCTWTCICICVCTVCGLTKKGPWMVYTLLDSNRRMGQHSRHQYFALQIAQSMKIVHDIISQAPCYIPTSNLLFCSYEVMMSNLLGNSAVIRW